VLPTTQRALDAYGGEQRWRAASAVEATISAGGLAFRMKWRRPLDHVRGHAKTARSFIRLDPIDRRGRVGVLDGAEVRLEDAAGDMLRSRPDPHARFPHGRRLLWWDALDMTYFSGYALWNYLMFPALLLRDDIEWTEPRDGTLDARFPPHIPTHSERQSFHFDAETGLLRQHDYTAEVFGNWARAAHVVLEHATSDGLTYPSRRRVTPRARDGSPRRGPVLVWIEVHDWRLV
jgi:hypothetical protein